MKHDPLLAPPAGWLGGVHLGSVVSVRDSLGIGRVQVRVPSLDADLELWARVAVAFAGPDYGAFLIPDVGDEVLVAFIGGDPRHPVVVGSLWHGAHRPPESLPGSSVDRWTLTGKAGTRIAILEPGSGRESIGFETPAGVSGTLTDEGGGKVEFRAAGVTVTLDAAGVTVNAPGGVAVTAPSVTVTAGQVTVNAAATTFNGVVNCTALVTQSVASTSYSPGAGNVW